MDRDRIPKRAPPSGAFLGDGSVQENEAFLAFERPIFRAEGSTVPCAIRIESPTGDEAHGCSPGAAGLGGGQRVEANHGRSQWTRIRGSWSALLQNLSAFRIAIEVVTQQESTGIDDVELLRRRCYASEAPGPDANGNGRPDDGDDPDANGMPTLLADCPIASPSRSDADGDRFGDACDPS